MANWTGRLVFGAALMMLAPVSAHMAGGDNKGALGDKTGKGTSGSDSSGSSSKVDLSTPESARAVAEKWSHQGFDNALCGFLSLYSNAKETGNQIKIKNTQQTKRAVYKGACSQPAEGKVDAMIAVLPDPVHTHLALRFDRAVNDLQNSVQQLGWTFDKAWMPWSSGTSPIATRFGDRTIDREMLDAWEDEPGLVLFRGDPARSLKPLIVMVVGDTPTAGVNETQFRKAAAAWRWLNTGPVPCPTGQDCNPGRRLMILGPTFTGSASSMKRVLDSEFSGKDKEVCGTPGIRIQIISGTMTSTPALRKLSTNCGKDDDQSVGASSFAVDMNYARVYLLNFIYDRLQNDERGIAELTEEESVFGNLSKDRAPLGETIFNINTSRKEYAEARNDGAKERYARQVAQSQNALFSLIRIYGEPPPKYTERGLFSDRPQLESQLQELAKNRVRRPLQNFVFPRGISLLRKAYEQNGVFGFGSNSSTGKGPKTELQLSFAEDARDDDSVAAYAGMQGAASMESRMAQIAATLERERISVVLLSATDVLDDIFVAKYLQAHAPRVTIVLMDADVLFLRGGAETSLDGVYVMSPYPLLPRNREWTRSQWSVEPPPSLPPSQGDQGTANAIRYLLCGAGTLGTSVSAAPLDCFWSKRDQFVTPYLPLSEYEPPFSIGKKENNGYSFGSEANNDSKLQPPLWLSVIAHGNFVPLALLDIDQLDKKLPEASAFNLPRLGTIQGEQEDHEENLREPTAPHGIQQEPMLQLKVMILIIALFCAVHTSTACGLASTAPLHGAMRALMLLHGKSGYSRWSA